MVLHGYFGQGTIQSSEILDWRSQTATLQRNENQYHISWDVKAHEAFQSGEAVPNLGKQPLGK